MGTVVKRKRGGALLGEIMNPGDTLLVAHGGKGGLGVVRPAAQPSARSGRGKFLDEVRSLAVLGLQYFRWKMQDAEQARAKVLPAKSSRMGSVPLRVVGLHVPV